MTPVPRIVIRYDSSLAGASRLLSNLADGLLKLWTEEQARKPIKGGKKRKAQRKK